MKCRLPGPKIPAKQRPCAGRKATDVLVVHVYPFDLAASDGVGDVVQCVARDTQQCLTPANCSVSTTISATVLWLITESFLTGSAAANAN
jgi:hypothetical protein